PSDLAPVVSAILGLHDFVAKAPGKQFQGRSQPKETGAFETTMSPGDFAIIYNLTPLYQAGYTGTGQKIAIVGRCAINTADIAAFRTEAGIPASPIQNYVQTVLPTGAVDPGPKGAQSTKDCDEAYLDIEWAGAVAPSASVVYVYASVLDVATQW